MQIPKDLNNQTEYPGMVHWFSPTVLFKVAQKAVASIIFGQYADRRLIRASLDILTDEALAERLGDGSKFKRDKDGAVWIDYVADLGDGFDSTYAIAYLLGQPSLDVEGAGTLPRAGCLIMGGDQVYPDATRYDYQTRMKRPYEYAFPDNEAEDAVHPHLFLIPGNHDWYDGLTLFLAMFCRGRETKFGNWRTSQHRSYFALRLPDNWWIWGYDSQLMEDIDQPQSDYFVRVAKMMPKNAKIILCAAVPSWLKAELSVRDKSQRELFYRGLDYIACIARKECQNASVCAVLSGDLHHYSRYSADQAKTQFITAGGGGAFLHPTHQLKDTITASWVSEKQILQLKTTPDADHKPSGKAACYPDMETSKKMTLGNLKFPWLNWDFCLVLGVLYWLTALVLTASIDITVDQNRSFVQNTIETVWALVSSPVFLVLFVGLVLIFRHYADLKKSFKKWVVGAVHALAHGATILVAASAAHAGVELLPDRLPTLITAIGSLLPGDWWRFFGFAAGVIVSGLVGGVIWGIYLFIALRCFGIHYNDGYSSMRLDSHRHFLRMKVQGDQLTIYPIGVDQSPSRSDWKFNECDQENDQSASIVVPKEAISTRLIEGPVEIRATNVTSLEDIASE